MAAGSTREVVPNASANALNLVSALELQSATSDHLASMYMARNSHRPRKAKTPSLSSASRTTSRACLSLTLALLLLPACSRKEAREVDAGGGWVGVCVDADGDGYGFQCKPGADCDDEDVNVHEGCARCKKASDGCACEADAGTVECTVDPELNKNGDLVCKEGLRYCRDQKWSGCEGLRSFLAPPPSRTSVRFQGLVKQDAGPVSCGSVCNPDCYKVEDQLEPYDAGAGGGVVSASGGGITVASGQVASDAGSAGGTSLNDYSCTLGVAPDVDCDKIPDTFDQYDDAAPFQTDNKTIFMDLAAGQSATQKLNVNFKLKSADVYFLLDMTATMAEERDELVAALTSNAALYASTSSVTCSDRNYDGIPDNSLKTMGVAGNIACLIRDARFGAGWFRDIPFAPGSNALTNISITPDYRMFENRVDITADVSTLSSQLAGFANIGNRSVPEGDIQALWPVLSGGEVYAGWDRAGTPKRLCASGRWGYPCFRTGAIPIIVHVTDEVMHEGPDYLGGLTGTVNRYPYSNWATLNDMQSGTQVSGLNMIPLAPGEAESFDTVKDMGEVIGSYKTVAGTTDNMTADLSYAVTGACPASTTAWSTTDQAGPDAVHKFHVGTAGKPIQISTYGSRFDSTVLIMGAGSMPTVTNIPVANNGTLATAKTLGILGTSGRFIVTGTTATNPSVYGREALSVGTGKCFDNTSADPVDAASVMKFQVGTAMKVRVTTTAASGAETALLAGSALEPTNIDLNTLNCGAGASANCNDKLGNYNIGDLAGAHVQLYNGTTAAATNDYAVGSCGGTAYGSARDTVVDFSLSTQRSLRIESSPKAAATLATGTGFAHGLFVYKKAAAASTVVKPVANGASGTQATATSILASDVPATAGNWVSYQGDSSADTPTYTQTAVGGTAANICKNGNVGAPSDQKDIVFKFDTTGAGTQTYEFDTAPTDPATGYKTWLSLHAGTIGLSPVVPSSNASELDAAATAGGQLVSSNIDNTRTIVTGGLMNLRVKNYTAAETGLFGLGGPILLGDHCGEQGSGDGRDALFKFTTTAAGQVKIATVDATGTPGTQPGFRSFVSVFKANVTAANRKSDDCPAPGLFGTATDARQSGNAWSETISVDAASTYYVVVKEWKYGTTLNATSGAFGLIIEDTDYAATFKSCDAGSSLTNGNYSRITATLTAGVYYLVLKGTGTAPNSKYALNIRRPPSGLGTVQSCANSTSNRAALDLDNLAAGDYSLIIKGTGTNSGGYSVSLRDKAAAPIPIDCHNSATAGSNFTTASNLTPGVDYYLVTRANTTAGTYQVIVDDSSVAVASAASSCNDDHSDYGTSSWFSSTPPVYPMSEFNVKNALIMNYTLPVGDYYAIVKGRTAADKGWYQLSIGEASSIAKNQTFQPKKYYGTAGVKEYIESTKAKIITVYSGNELNVVPDLATPGVSPNRGDDQLKIISQHSGATEDGTTTGVPLYRKINANGTGIGDNVVSAVNSLVNALKMNLTVVLSTSPDSPPPGKPFGFSVQALTSTSNCNATTTDTDGNGLKDTFVGCGPGAAPDWNVTFTNPLANPVPPNAADPNGGYNMRLQLIGDRNVPAGSNYPGFVVDEIPVYIIPADVVPNAVVEQYSTSGTYEQTVPTQCSGTDTPIWRSLDWTASLPATTSVEWKFCGGNTDAEVASCSLQTAATLTSSNVACTPATQLAACGAGSFCGKYNKCETLRATLACTPSNNGAECGAGGVCVTTSGDSRCQYTSRPIDMTNVLNVYQGRPKIRVGITMNASTDRASAPTVYDWRLDYYCAPGL
jgi:hypothetical protein